MSSSRNEAVAKSAEALLEQVGSRITQQKYIARDYQHVDGTSFAAPIASRRSSRRCSRRTPRLHARRRFARACSRRRRRSKTCPKKEIQGRVWCNPAAAVAWAEAPKAMMRKAHIQKLALLAALLCACRRKHTSTTHVEAASQSVPAGPPPLRCTFPSGPHLFPEEIHRSRRRCAARSGVRPGDVDGRYRKWQQHSSRVGPRAGAQGNGDGSRVNAALKLLAAFTCRTRRARMATSSCSARSTAASSRAIRSSSSSSAPEGIAPRAAHLAFTARLLAEANAPHLRPRSARSRVGAIPRVAAGRIRLSMAARPRRAFDARHRLGRTPVATTPSEHASRGDDLWWTALR